MRKYLADVAELHAKMGLPLQHTPKALSEDEAIFRTKFIIEELTELKVARSIDDKIDAIIDVAYVALGTILYTGETDLPWKPYALKGLGYRLLVVHPDLHSLYKDSLNKLASAGISKDRVATVQANLTIFSYSYRLMQLFDLSFDDHWNLVHTCNMAKIPCSLTNPSSRGHTDGSDLVKPVGWKGPDHLRLIT